MMTKYQLVFAKIECQVNRVLNSNKLREMGLSQRAFNKLKWNAQACHSQEHLRLHSINIRFRSTLATRMLSRYRTNQVARVKKAFLRWRLSVGAAKVLARCKQALDSQVAGKTAEQSKLKEVLQQKQ